LAWTFSRAIPLLDENGEIVEWFGAASDITRGKQAEAALRETNALLEQKVQERTAELAKRAHQLRALGGKLRQSEQSERRRLAKVLHDHLQQILVGAKFRVAILGRTGDDLVRQAAEEVENLLDESIGASRSLTAQLSPPVLHDAGLSTSLEWLARWMADRHGLIVDLQVEGHLPRLAVDLNTLLFESTRELLFNAVKHARVHAATVDIRMVENDMLQVTVSDEGKGFDPARIAAAGEPEGGFGLFAIREQLDLFGGQMEIDSAPGRGSRFILRVPTAAHAAREEPVAELLEHAGEGRTDAAHPPGTGVRIRILLADDHTVMREGLVQLLGLEPDFLIVGEAADGQETLDLTDKLLPDVILMDLNMPKLSGLDATRIIHSRHPGIRILGLSMFEGAERAQDMLSAGAVGYLVKSGPSSDLIAAIRASMSAGAEPDRTAGEASGKSIARQQGSGFDPQR
jgi:signal transduction histidine kinase/CheY-like chemotaxis protein